VINSFKICDAASQLKWIPSVSGGVYFAGANFQGHMISGVKRSGFVTICTAGLIFLWPVFWVI
jgi:hypothetical protein